MCEYVGSCGVHKITKDIDGRKAWWDVGNGTGMGARFVLISDVTLIKSLNSSKSLFLHCQKK